MLTTQQQEEQRIKMLYEYTPFLFIPMGRRVLYIGGAPGRIQLVRALKEPHQIFLLEAYRPNLDAIMQEDAQLDQPNFCGYHCGNVVSMGLREMQNIFGHIDHVVWWHGPEHIERFELRSTLRTLEALADDSIVLGCPYGVFEQGAVGENHFEIHRSHFYPGDLEAYGYSTVTIGERDGGPDSCLIAWKRVNRG